MEEQLVVLMDPWHDKHERLLEAHERLQKLNQTLEEKLLKLAENHHVETQRLSYQMHELTQRLVEARLYIHQLEDENERYRSDINVVVQLLHCKPSNFVSPKLETLPDDLQRKVISLRTGSNCKKEKKIIKVQVPTFPPTDIMYSVDKGKGKKSSEKDIVSAAIMAKILEERENERKENRKNRCKCASKIVLPLVDSETQTLPACTVPLWDFNVSDYEDDEDDVIEDDEDEEIMYEKKTPTRSQPLNMSHSSSNTSDLSKFHSTQTPIHERANCNLQNPTVDDIMKTDQKEEELLPTPIFLRRNNKESLIKHESQDSTYSSGSSNCNTTTNSSNSNISHSSRISSGTYEEEVFSRSHPSPTSHSHSISSASPDIHVEMNQPHFFDTDDFDPESIMQGFNAAIGGIGMLLQNAHHPESQPGQGQSSPATSSSGRMLQQQQQQQMQKVPGRPQSINLGRNLWESHWRSTVLVHQPPKSKSYEPLALTSTHHNTSTFSAEERDVPDSPTQEESPLLVSRVHTHQTAQYYQGGRGHKKGFWSRSSVETEI